MALDIGRLEQDGRGAPRVQFADDGYFWFLYPWFLRIADDTALAALDAGLAAARTAAQTVYFFGD